MVCVLLLQHQSSAVSLLLMLVLLLLLLPPKRLLRAGADGLLKLWDARTGANTATFEGAQLSRLC